MNYPADPRLMEAKTIPSINDPGVRAYAAQELCLAIAACHPEDALQILSAALEDLQAGRPIVSFENIRSDAEFWADCASPAELECYFAASLKALRKKALGQKARKRLFVELWEAFSVAEKAAFVSRVDPDGEFRRRSA